MINHDILGDHIFRQSHFHWSQKSVRYSEHLGYPRVNQELRTGVGPFSLIKLAVPKHGDVQ